LLRHSAALLLLWSRQTPEDQNGFQLSLERRDKAEAVTAWIPDFAGMTASNGVTAFDGMTGNIT